MMLIVAAALASAANGTAQNLNTVQAAQAQALVDTAGVNTHLTYTNTVYYTSWPQILSALTTLGVKHLRDGYWNVVANDPVAEEHQELANAGITTDYVIPWGNEPTPQQLQQFRADVGDMEAIEAPNECDTPGACGGGGNAGIANVIGMLPSLLSDAQTANVPLMGPSFLLPTSYATAGNLASLMNLNSLHLYFGGRNPGSPGWGAEDPEGNDYGSFAYWVNQSNLDAPGIVPVVTETGYISSPTTSTPFTIPESVEASYVPRTLLLSFQNGYQECFFYQLIDDPSSTSGYGLLNSDLSPKPAYTALQNLLSLMSDPGGSFSPGTLSFNVTGGGSDLEQMLFEKSNGDFYLVLWLEDPSYNPVTNQTVAVTPENVALHLQNGYATTTDYQFNNAGSVTAFNQPENNGTAILTATDQISVIKIIPAS